jgi:hypothetical protein
MVRNQSDIGLCTLRKKLKYEIRIRDACQSSPIWENETRLHHRVAKLPWWRIKRRRSIFWRVLVKLSETCMLLWQKGDECSYCTSPIMQVKETRVSKCVSHFITKMGVSPILSPTMKAGASPFIMKEGASPISYIEASDRMSRLRFISPLKRVPS